LLLLYFITNFLDIVLLLVIWQLLLLKKYCLERKTWWNLMKF